MQLTATKYTTTQRFITNKGHVMLRNTAHQSQDLSDEEMNWWSITQRSTDPGINNSGGGGGAAGRQISSINHH